MKEIKKWTKSKTFLIVFNSILSLSIVVSSMVIIIDHSRIKNGAVYAGASADTSESVTTPGGVPTTSSKLRSARLMCAGDNLIHRGIFNQANDRADGDGYNFTFAYDNIRDIIKESDIAFISQETVMDSSNDPSSSPNFNSPTQLLAEMIDIGFDVYNQATKHIMDMDVSGAKNDIKLFNDKGSSIILTGLYDTWDDMLKPKIITEKDITFSFVGFTESLNDINVPDDSDIGLLYLTDTRHTQEELYSRMQEMIEAAKKVSDVVCVSMQWKEENIKEPSESQKEIVDKLLSYGADIIIGTGTQVLQPFEFKTNSDGEQALVMWSLGDFISCQDEVDNLLGGIADITVTKDITAKTISIDAKLIPTITHYSESTSDVHIVPLSDYTETLVENHGITYTHSEFTMDYINNYYNKMFGNRLETTLIK